MIIVSVTSLSKKILNTINSIYLIPGRVLFSPFCILLSSGLLCFKLWGALAAAAGQRPGNLNQRNLYIVCRCNR